MAEINEKSKQQQLAEFKVDHDNTKLTTNQGLRISHTDDALKAGERGVAQP